jgi:hypothetical protein
MPPRPGIDPSDVMTPKQIAAALDVPESTIRVWIHRYKVQRLGQIGRWNVYDFRDLAAIEARLHAQRAAAA